MKAFLAEAMALTGDLDNALQLIDEQIAQIERPGWEERLYYAEILRLKGWMLSLKGDLEGAERNFLASLDWARRQQAKMWELRTSTSLARLWQSQGKRQDAYELLAPVYGWFTEGFDTKDLLDAKSLLAELAPFADSTQAGTPMILSGLWCRNDRRQAVLYCMWDGVAGRLSGVRQSCSRPGSKFCGDCRRSRSALGRQPVRSDPNPRLQPSAQRPP